MSNVDFLGPSGSEQYVTRACSITLAMAAKRCYLCRKEVPDATKRRRLTNPDVIAYVCSMIGACPDPLAITCRACFSTLEKGIKAATTLKSMISESRRSIGLSSDVSIKA